MTVPSVRYNSPHRVTAPPTFPRTVSVLALKVLHQEKAFGFRQTGWLDALLIFKIKDTDSQFQNRVITVKHKYY